MAARISPSDDPVRPGPTTPLTITVDGEPLPGLAGQTIAGVLLAAGRSQWRTSPRGRPRGLFCGIGVCHDCLLTVNALPDVRACQRRATDGDVITTTDNPADPADFAGPASAVGPASPVGPVGPVGSAGTAGSVGSVGPAESTRSAETAGPADAGATAEGQP